MILSFFFCIEFTTASILCTLLASDLKVFNKDYCFYLRISGLNYSVCISVLCWLNYNDGFDNFNDQNPSMCIIDHTIQTKLEKTKIAGLPQIIFSFKFHWNESPKSIHDYDYINKAQTNIQSPNWGTFEKM